MKFLHLPVTVFLLALPLLMLLHGMLHAQPVTVSEEQLIKREARRFFDSYTAFLNQLGNSNIKVQQKKELIDQYFLDYFTSNEAAIEQDLKPEGKGRVVRVKTADTYLNNITVYYLNVVLDHQNIKVGDIFRVNNEQQLIISFDRSFEAIDRNSQFIKSTTLRRDAFVKFEKNERGQWLFRIKNIAFHSPQDIDSLKVPVVPDPQTISVISPTNESFYQPGNAITVLWESNIQGNVRIELFRNDRFVKTINSNVVNNGTLYGYRLPQGLVADSTYQIKITSILDSRLSDTSKKFTIGYPDSDNKKPQRRAKGKALLLGLRAGANRSYLAETGFTGNNGKPGTSAGITVGFALSPGFALRTGLNLADRGQSEAVSGGNGAYRTLTTRYIEVPLYMEFYFKSWEESSFKYFIGPQFSLLQSAFFEGEAGNPSLAFFPSATGADVKEQISGTDLGINIGLGYDFLLGQKLKLALETQYYFGISQLDGESSAGSDWNGYSNRTLSAHLGLVYLIK